MEAIAHNPAFAAKMGVPQHVAQEFVAADKRKKQAQQFQPPDLNLARYP
jgi:hypothetical protein